MLASPDSAGREADGQSEGPDISPDGRYVSFSSFANDLVASPSDSDAPFLSQDAFVRDRLAGSTELVPNVETAAGLVRTLEIARSSPRITALLVASEDMVADLGTERSRGGGELAYVRARFLVECRAAGVEAIDCPYTFSDARGARADALQAKRLGYRAKSLVSPAHAQAINRVFTPDKKEIAHARRVVSAFEKARAAGKERALVDGALIEVPIYAAARRLLDRIR